MADRRTTCLHCGDTLDTDQQKRRQQFCQTQHAYAYRRANGARLRAEAEAQAQQRAAQDAANLKAWLRLNARIAAKHQRRQEVAA